MNLNKCVKIIKEKNCDAMILFDEKNMHYLCSFSPSEGIIVIIKNGQGYHIVDSRYTQTAKEYSKTTGLNVIEINKGFFQTVSEIVSKNNCKTILFEDETISYAKHKMYTEKLHCDFVPLGNAIMQLRNVKEVSEIDMIKKANSIAEKSFLELLPKVEPGKTEKELAAEFDYIMAQNGSDGVSFATILLTGEHTSMPHGVPSEKKIQYGHFILFDFGATFKGYHSDMTRTVAVGHADDEMKKTYNLVLRAQKAGIKALKDGAKCSDVYQAAYDVLEEEKMGSYFRHSLGHGVGLDIHEGYNASSKSKDIFTVGNVTSIEPGIYLPGKYGIRIEDLLYISPRGRENLSNITKELIIL